MEWESRSWTQRSRAVLRRRCGESDIAANDRKLRRLDVRLAERVSPELAEVAQEFLATEH